MPYVVVISVLVIFGLVLRAFVKYKESVRESNEAESTKLHSIMDFLSTRTMENVSVISKTELMIKLNMAPKELANRLSTLVGHSLVKDYGDKVSITQFGEKVQRTFRKDGQSHFK